VPTSRVLPSGRVKETWGRGLEVKNGDRGGKLAIWIRMLVHPESAIRGDEQEEKTEDRADIGAGRDTGERITVAQRRLRKGCGLVTGRFDASIGRDGRETVSSSSSDSESEISDSESAMREEKGLGVENRDVWEDSGVWLERGDRIGCGLSTLVREG
jgi:hypothetical protein